MVKADPSQYHPKSPKDMSLPGPNRVTPGQPVLSRCFQLFLVPWRSLFPPMLRPLYFWCTSGNLFLLCLNQTHTQRGGQKKFRIKFHSAGRWRKTFTNDTNQPRRPVNPVERVLILFKGFISLNTATNTHTHTQRPLSSVQLLIF